MSCGVFQFGHAHPKDASSSQQTAPAEPTKRASRACDRCRHARMKCVRPGDEFPCQACAQVKIECTMSGPRFRSGPPKGYIRALEQRWYQAEAILGVLLSSPNSLAESVTTVLRHDPMAREVLDRVSSGPFSLLGRAHLPQDSSMQDVMAFATRGHDNGARPKQPRSSREDLASETPIMTFGQLTRWQDRLAMGFASSPTSLTPYTVYVPQAATHAENVSEWSRNLYEEDMSDTYTTGYQSEHEEEDRSN
ncbi:hypothetical protein OE88DRAFT_1668228 [Heliocybe sulcata]|uniref:Zn(2)-C6 fungal-type domain-containing protein n=1 Tax=Heliocybe sulcata TaxID=5364 RepID=A0A5C3MKZ2_9AGAM|nr:hypothetical protein OE88DRAFT_1668228 [Heliocybe sulcata]